MKALVEDLRSRLEVARQGGSEAARRKHLDRGKLLARDRVDQLLDPGTPFLELSPLAATGMYGASRSELASHADALRDQIPADAPYMPVAASGLSSRNGVPGS